MRGRNVHLGSQVAACAATHGKEVHAECCRLLESLGYRLQPLDQRPLADTDELVARPA